MKKRTILALLLTLLTAGLLVSYTLAQPYDEGRRERPEAQAAERREREINELREQIERLRQGRERRGERERRPRREPDFERPVEFGRMYAWMEVVERMGDMAFNPEVAGLIAIGAIKDDIPREPVQRIKDLENLLGRTRTLGLRNAIRMGLKDLYLHTEQPEKALDQMRAMLAENDEYLSLEMQEDHDEEYDEDEDEDEDEPERR